MQGKLYPWFELGKEKHKYFVTNYKAPYAWEHNIFLSFPEKLGKARARYGDYRQ